MKYNILMVRYRSQKGKVEVPIILNTLGQPDMNTVQTRVRQYVDRKLSKGQNVTAEDIARYIKSTLGYTTHMPTEVIHLGL